MINAAVFESFFYLLNSLHTPLLLHTQVTISGLFDMSSMMDHIAAQYIHSYASANTRVTVRNYQKFKVLETLTSAGDVATADFINPSGTCSRAPECPGASENAAAGACGAAATSNDAAAAVSTASTASAVGVGVTPVCRSVAKPVEGSNVVSLASPVAARKNCCSSVPGSPGRVGGGGGPGVVEVKAKDLAKMTHPIAFHEGLTLPFTGDSSVEAYYERIEEIMSPYIEAVCVWCVDDFVFFVFSDMCHCLSSFVSFLFLS